VTLNQPHRCHHNVHLALTTTQTTTSQPSALSSPYQNTYDSDSGNTTIEVSCFMEAFKEAREWVGLEFPVKSNVGGALYDWLYGASAYNQVACASNPRCLDG
tara:strand:+ start:519 stop:824 length:306 start_codon:yes stop_codon:yes gene_type:complete